MVKSLAVGRFLTGALGIGGESASQTEICYYVVDEIFDDRDDQDGTTYLICTVMVLARFVSSSRATLAGRGVGGGSVVPASATTCTCTPKLLGDTKKLQKESNVGDDSSAISPVKIYQGSIDASFHVGGTVRFFSGIRNIPRDEALKHMSLLKKANSTEAVYILEDIEREGYIPSVALYNKAISKCAKDGKLNGAKKLFGQMKHKKVMPSVVTFNSLIDACAHVGNDKEAVRYLREMEEKHGLWPNVVSYNSTISACEKAGNWNKAIELLREMPSRGVTPDVISFNSTISACEKGGQTEQALNLLGEMEDNGIEATVVTFGAAISSCEKGGAAHTETALALFSEMCNREIWPNDITYSAAISACEKGGADYTDTALQLFEEMKELGVEPDVVAYGAIISACEKGGADYTQTALGLFEELQEKKITPTETTYNATISACEKGGAKYTDTALQLFEEMKELEVEPSVITYSAAISACEKGGADYTQTALGLFDELQEKKITPDEIVFGALISACGKGGDKYVDIALQKFDKMKSLGIEPNDITYTAITKTCYDNSRYPEALEKVQECLSVGMLSSLEADSEKWDLHHMREATACTLLADALITFVHAASFRKIQVITGKGNNSPEGPVLQVKVPAFLRDVAGLELTEHINKNGEVNEGAFFITKNALKKWAKSDDFNRFRALMTGKERE